MNHGKGRKDDFTTHAHRAHKVGKGRKRFKTVKFPAPSRGNGCAGRKDRQAGSPHQKPQFPWLLLALHPLCLCGEIPLRVRVLAYFARISGRLPRRSALPPHRTPNSTPPNAERQTSVPSVDSVRRFFPISNPALIKLTEDFSCYFWRT